MQSLNIKLYNAYGYYTGTTYGFVNSDAQYTRSTSVQYKSYMQGLISSEADGDFTTSLAITQRIL